MDGVEVVEDDLVFPDLDSVRCEHHRRRPGPGALHFDVSAGWQEPMEPERRGEVWKLEAVELGSSLFGLDETLLQHSASYDLLDDQFRDSSSYF